MKVLADVLPLVLFAGAAIWLASIVGQASVEMLSGVFP